MVQENNLGEILIICGPTASSKTELAVKCAKILKTEIISADALYIYKNLNIGTAKPTSNEMMGIKHHLIDVVGLDDRFSVGEYKKLAEPIINGLISKNKIPIICGGTGFYINSILYDLSYGNIDSNNIFRDKYKALAEKYGNEYVYNILKEKDPNSALKLHFNDSKRVIRALEIYESGIKKSELNDSFKPKYKYKAFIVDYPRETLYERINQRVDKMIELGLLEEVKNLYKNGYNLNSQCMQGIGYKEILKYLDNKITLDEAIELIKLNTRHYAKRQITFFKKMDNLIKIQPDTIDKMASKIVSYYDKY